MHILVFEFTRCSLLLVLFQLYTCRFCNVERKGERFWFCNLSEKCVSNSFWYITRNNLRNFNGPTSRAFMVKPDTKISDDNSHQFSCNCNIFIKGLPSVVFVMHDRRLATIYTITMGQYITGNKPDVLHCQATCKLILSWWRYGYPWAYDFIRVA